MSAPRKRCSQEGCNKISKKGGLCVRHYKEEYGTNAWRQCSYEGCDNYGQNEGLCKRHYKEKFGLSLPQKRCGHEGCYRQSQKEGLCCTHYKEKFGTSVTRQQCSHEGCDKYVQKKSLCARHCREKFGMSAVKQCSNKECCVKQVQKDSLHEQYGANARKGCSALKNEVATSNLSSDDEDSDDELGALIYQSSETAKAFAIAKSESGDAIAEEWGDKPALARSMVAGRGSSLVRH